ncbi:hypothetical protein GYA37_01585 [candidate division WWE3 bacterium]|uniref:Uncharacterized protein n=1 Tax=candidate division WWE3 bacterium TaxID=2053526 RepID=A0A7X9HTL3_UNCKA|nr:hypothetical protein [candidate division WWE3 bacterium]
MKKSFECTWLVGVFSVVFGEGVLLEALLWRKGLDPASMILVVELFVLAAWCLWKVLKVDKGLVKQKREFDEENFRALESRLFDEALEVYKTLFKGHNPNAPAKKLLCTLCVSMSLKEKHGNEESSVISLANEILLGIRNNSFPDSDCVEVKETDDGIELKAGLYSVTKKYNQYSNSLGSGARIVVYPKPRYKKS